MKLKPASGRRIPVCLGGGQVLLRICETPPMVKYRSSRISRRVRHGRFGMDPRSISRIGCSHDGRHGSRDPCRGMVYPRLRDDLLRQDQEDGGGRHRFGSGRLHRHRSDPEAHRGPSEAVRGSGPAADSGHAVDVVIPVGTHGVIIRSGRGRCLL